MDSKIAISEFQAAIPKIKSLSKYETRLDDDFLLRFLKVAKFDVKKAVKRYEAYYTYLLSLPLVDDILTGELREYQHLLDSMQEVDQIWRDQGMQRMLNYYGFDTKNRAIIGMDSGAFVGLMEIHQQGLELSLIMTLCVMDKLLEDHPDLNDTGIVSIENQASFNMKMFKAMMSNMGVIKKMAGIMEGTVPLRFNKCWIANGPKLITALWNICKKFLTQKIIDKCDFVNNTRVISEDLGGDEFLPDFLGGKNSLKNLDFSYAEQVRKVFPVIRHTSDFWKNLEEQKVTKWKKKNV